ncbi:hypothetical protein ACPA9J_03775 [Pseudomonas aeruginosa]
MHHPEIRRDHPGTGPSGDDAGALCCPTSMTTNPELVTSRRFWWTLR